MKSCFLCGRNGRGDRLERHHIFGGARRPLSEKYGLVVYLCGERCHRTGEYSCHKNAINNSGVESLAIFTPDFFIKNIAKCIKM